MFGVLNYLQSEVTLTVLKHRIIYISTKFLFTQFFHDHYALDKGYH